MKAVRCFPILLVLFLIAAGQPTEDRLKKLLKRFPDADTNGDGTLTVEEARAYWAKRTARRESQPGRARRLRASVHFDPAATKKSAKGLWVGSTGHSIVAPAMIPFKTISLAAGYDNHQQLALLSGGASGSPRALWKRTGDMKPALETGKLDVLTMGVFIDSTAEDFAKWIDLGLKHNPKMVFYIQDAWPRMQSPEKKRPLTFFETQQKLINTLVSGLVKKLNAKYPGKVHVIPVGNGMVELVRRFTADKLPGVDRVYVPKREENKAQGLYRDAIHPTKVVAQLEGYIYYACLYKKNPAGVSGGSIIEDTKLDKLLREVAWKIVCEHPHSGVGQKG